MTVRNDSEDKTLSPGVIPLVDELKSDKSWVTITHTVGGGVAP